METRLAVIITVCARYFELVRCCCRCFMEFRVQIKFHFANRIERKCKMGNLTLYARSIYIWRERRYARVTQFWHCRSSLCTARHQMCGMYIPRMLQQTVLLAAYSSCAVIGTLSPLDNSERIGISISHVGIMYSSGDVKNKCLLGFFKNVW